MQQKIGFNPSDLTEHQLGCVEFVLNSPAYIDVFEPYLRTMRDSINLRLLDRSPSRKEEYSDDFLAGNIIAIDGLLALFKTIISETRIQRMADSVTEVTPAEQYRVAQAEGRHDPVLGANEPLEQEVYRPEEDY